MNNMFGPKNAKEAEVFAIEELIAETQYCIQSVMKEKGVRRSELAKRLGCSAANVTRMLSEDSNLTLESIARVLHAVDDKCMIRSKFLEESVRRSAVQNVYSCDGLPKWLAQETSDTTENASSSSANLPDGWPGTDGEEINDNASLLAA